MWGNRRQELYYVRRVLEKEEGSCLLRLLLTRHHGESINSWQGCGEVYWRASRSFTERQGGSVSLWLMLVGGSKRSPMVGKVKISRFRTIGSQESCLLRPTLCSAPDVFPSLPAFTRTALKAGK